MAASMRTLDALRNYAEKVSVDHGLSSAERETLLQGCRRHAALIAALVEEREQNRAYGFVAEIESR